MYFKEIIARQLLPNSLTMTTGESLAILCAVILGVLLFLWLMWPHRAELKNVPLRQSLEARSHHLAFICAEYKGRYFYWETVELVRKLFLNGIAVLILQGSVLQLGPTSTGRVVMHPPARISTRPPGAYNY